MDPVDHQAAETKAEITDVFGPLLKKDEFSFLELRTDGSNLYLTDGSDRVLGIEEGMSFEEPSQEDVDRFNSTFGTDYKAGSPEKYTV